MRNLVSNLVLSQTLDPTSKPVVGGIRSNVESKWFKY